MQCRPSARLARLTLPPLCRGQVVSFGLFCTESPVTCVALVLAGGVGTIRQCAQRVGLPSAGRHRTQVLVVANTGGAADVIAYAWKLVHEPDSGNTYVV